MKLGAKNWQAIGHPSAGPRLANLFSLVENCMQEGINPEAYLIDIITRPSDHPMKDIAELLPWGWRATRPASTAAVAGLHPTRVPDLARTLCLLELHAYTLSAK